MGSLVGSGLTTLDLREISPVSSPIHFTPSLPHKYVMSLAPSLCTLPAYVRPFCPRAVAKNRGRERRREVGRRGRKGERERERDSESTPYRRSCILHHTHGQQRYCRPGGSLGSVQCVCGDAVVARRRRSPLPGYQPQQTGVDCSRGRAGAEATRWLHRELRGLPRAWSRPAGGPVHAGAPILLLHGAPQLQSQLHRVGGHLRRRLRGVPRHCPPLGAVAPPLSGGAHHQAGRHTEGDEGRRLHSPSAPRLAAPLHPGPAVIVQPSLV